VPPPKSRLSLVAVKPHPLQPHFPFQPQPSAILSSTTGRELCLQLRTSSWRLIECALVIPWRRAIDCHHVQHKYTSDDLHPLQGHQDRLPRESRVSIAPPIGKLQLTPKSAHRQRPVRFCPRYTPNTGLLRINLTQFDIQAFQTRGRVCSALGLRPWRRSDGCRPGPALRHGEVVPFGRRKGRIRAGHAPVRLH
jgi:hypothetical protein